MIPLRAERYSVERWSWTTLENHFAALRPDRSVEVDGAIDILMDGLFDGVSGTDESGLLLISSERWRDDVAEEAAELGAGPLKI